MATHTARLRKQRNKEQGEEQLDILSARNFEVVQFSEYHFRINNVLDVWPSTKKWKHCISGEMGVYEDLVELVREQFQV